MLVVIQVKAGEHLPRLLTHRVWTEGLGSEYVYVNLTEWFPSVEAVLTNKCYVNIDTLTAIFTPHLPLLFPITFLQFDDHFQSIASKNSLGAVLEVVIAPCPPVVQALSRQHVDMALRFLEGHSLGGGEDSVLQVSNQWTPSLEAREIALTHQHHLDQDNQLLGILLERAEAPSHSQKQILVRKFLNVSEFAPPITSTISCVSL